MRKSTTKRSGSGNQVTRGLQAVRVTRRSRFKIQKISLLSFFISLSLTTDFTFSPQTKTSPLFFLSPKNGRCRRSPTALLRHYRTIAYGGRRPKMPRITIKSSKTILFDLFFLDPPLYSFETQTKHLNLNFKMRLPNPKTPCSTALHNPNFRYVKSHLLGYPYSENRRLL